MKKEKINEIILAGQQLSEKQSWIKKGFQNILGKLNQEFAKIPNFEKEPSRFSVGEWENWDRNIWLIRKVYAELKFTDAVELHLIICKQESDWGEEELKNPSWEIIKEFAKKFPAMLDFFIVDIQKNNEVSQETIDIMKNVMKKLL